MLWRIRDKMKTNLMQHQNLKHETMEEIIKNDEDMRHSPGVAATVPWP